MLSPYDGLSLGIIAALKSNGYGGGGKPLPVVTGQDAEVQSVKSILAGEQYSTIFKDTRELAKVTVAMIKAIGAGKKPEVNDTKTYDNGNKVVPSYLLDPVPVDQGQRPAGPGRRGLLHRGRAQVIPAVGAPGRSAGAPTAPARHHHPDTRNRAHEPADPGDALHHQGVPWRQGAQRRQPHRQPRRHPRDLRGERRRQVHADEGAHRGLPARHLRRRHRLRGTRSSSSRTSGRARPPAS